MPLIKPAGGEGAPYRIARSLKFSYGKNPYLTRTPTLAGTNSIQTWSGWVKKPNIGRTQILFAAGADTSNYTILYFQGDQIMFYTVSAGTSYGQYWTASFFRDPSAWYHIVCVIDYWAVTDKLRIWVNGVLQPLVITTALTAATWFTSTTPHYIGRNMYEAPQYVDGNLADIQFIDGVVYDASWFGRTDPKTGVWVPKTFTGNYGGTGFKLDFADNSAATAATLGRDRSNTTNLLTYSDAFNNAAVWVPGNGAVLTAGQPGPNGGSSGVLLSTTGTANPYIHFVTTNWTLGPHVFSIYLKFVGTDYTQINVGNLDGAWINVYPDGTFGGLASGTGVLNGMTVTPTGINPGWFRVDLAFTRNTASTGDPVWITVPAVTTPGNGIVIYRACVNKTSVVGRELLYTNGAAIPAKDWTPVNMGVSGGLLYNDSHVDTPTNYGSVDTGVGNELGGNYALPSAIDKGPNTGLSNGGMTVQALVANWTSATTTMRMQSGKWYWEFTIHALDAASNCQFMVGIARVGLFPATLDGNYVGIDSYSYGYYLLNGNKYFASNPVAYGAGCTTNDVVGVAFNADTGALFFSKNGVWQGGGNPVAGTGAAWSGMTTRDYAPAVGVYNWSYGTFNFGQIPFAYAAPTGFKVLCSQNLPAPAVGKPSNYFNIATYSGDDTVMRDVPLGFQGDFWWSKSRNTGQNNAIIDSVRGTNWLSTNLSQQEFGAGQQYFTSTGIQATKMDLGVPQDMWNDTGNDYVAWVWKKGAVPGVDVVAFTAPASGAFIVPHGLGVKPAMFIAKCRGAVGSWMVWHQTFNNASTDYLALDTNNAVASLGSLWGIHTNVNVIFGGTGGFVPSQPHILYAFAEVPGFSAFGRYFGNGVVDGTFVHTGFKPRWVMTKRLNTIGDWWIQDTGRSAYNPVNAILFPNIPGGGEFSAAGVEVDLVSNGFKLRNTNLNDNANGEFFIYAAFAEHPFKYARAR